MSKRLSALLSSIRQAPLRLAEHLNPRGFIAQRVANQAIHMLKENNHQIPAGFKVKRTKNGCVCKFTNGGLRNEFEILAYGPTRDGNYVFGYDITHEVKNPVTRRSTMYRNKFGGGVCNSNDVTHISGAMREWLNECGYELSESAVAGLRLGIAV